MLICKLALFKPKQLGPDRALEALVRMLTRALQECPPYVTKIVFALDCRGLGADVYCKQFAARAVRVTMRAPRVHHVCFFASDSAVSMKGKISDT
jgi:hypothetical protein